MKYVRYFLATELQIAARVFLMGGVMGLLNWITSLIGLTKPPTWWNFIGFVVILIVITNLMGLYEVIATIRLARKDPVFKEGLQQRIFDRKGYLRIINSPLNRK